MVNHAVIVACTDAGGFAKDGNIPWTIKEDMKHFKNVTSNVSNPATAINAIIMGKTTWFTLPKRPLPNRINVVVSTELSSLNTSLTTTTTYFVRSFEAALETLHNLTHCNIENIFVIGGQELYNAAIRHPLFKTIYMTQVHADIECDRFIRISDIDDMYSMVDKVDHNQELNNSWAYSFVVFRKKI